MINVDGELFVNSIDQVTQGVISLDSSRISRKWWYPYISHGHKCYFQYWEFYLWFVLTLHFFFIQCHGVSSTFLSSYISCVFHSLIFSGLKNNS